MRIIRIALNLLIALSTTIIIGLLSYDQLSETNNHSLIENLLNLMHLSFFTGSIVNLFYYFKNKSWAIFTLLALPMTFFMIAFVGVFFHFKFSNVYLIIFDCYLIYLFIYLTVLELMKKYYELEVKKN